MWINFGAFIAASLTAISTIILSWMTYILAKETKVLARMTSKAFVITYLESTEVTNEAMNIVIHNTGNAPAFNVSVRITPAMPNYSHPSSMATETSYEVLLIPPTTKQSIYGVALKEMGATLYEVSVSWSETPKGSVRESISYQIKPKNQIKGGWIIKGIHNVATELEKLTNEVKKINDKIH